MIPQKIATGCRTRYFRHAKELRYAFKQFVSRIQIAEDGALMILIFFSLSRARARETKKISGISANCPRPPDADRAFFFGDPWHALKRPSHPIRRARSWSVCSSI